jgi:hypothetical protein
MNKYWYEVFEDLGEKEGTETLQTFSNLRIAKLFLKSLKEVYPKRVFHLDKWCFINGSPENILLIK